jgi:hypothetical protein
MRQFVLTLAVGLAVFPAWASDAQRYVPIETRLTEEQLQQTGLHQLSSAQLALLNRLLSEQQTAIVQTAKAEGSREASAGKLLVRDTAPVSSTVVGEMRGWSVGTVFTLANGQRWRVLQGDLFLRKPLANAPVEITSSKLGAWMLQLQGQNQRAKVERLD